MSTQIIIDTKKYTVNQMFGNLFLNSELSKHFVTPNSTRTLSLTFINE